MGGNLPKFQSIYNDNNNNQNNIPDVYIICSAKVSRPVFDLRFLKLARFFFRSFENGINFQDVFAYIHRSYIIFFFLCQFDDEWDKFI